MANIVAATVRLLETHNPQDITLRDVAQESGHGHRLIVEWFGGKGGLFAAVFNEIFQGLTESGGLFSADVPTRPEVRTAFKLFNFMQMHHREFVESVRSRVVVDTVCNRIRTVLGLSEERADLVARRIAVLSIGIALFGDFFELTEEEAILLMQDEFRTMTGLTLPAHRPTT